MAKRRPKVRLTVTVDAELLQAANAAVRAGRAESISGWVNEALQGLAAEDRRREAAAEVFAEYEAKYGEISERAMAEQERLDRLHAIRYRPRPRRVSTSVAA